MIQFIQKALSLTYGIVGLGLMGGSFARALKRMGGGHGGPRILACDYQRQTLEAAAKEGLIDEGYGASEVGIMLSQADVVFICLYPRQTQAFLIAHAREFAPGSIVTDIAGVKTSILLDIEQDFISPADFIPGHPMAGSEKEGFAYSSQAIFSGRNYILIPRKENRREHLDFLRDLIHALGFARIIETDACVHDHKIAFTSQLCHVIAAALVASAEDTEVRSFGGGSFEDLTRIAMINAPLWAELFLENRSELVSCIEQFEKELASFKRLIAEGAKDELIARLEEVRRIRTAMSQRKGEDA